MDIDDILKSRKFRSLDKYLTEEMHATAGELLVSKMIDVFESEARARDWFYSKIMPLSFKRPYDVCKDGKRNEIELLLGRIDHGIY